MTILAIDPGNRDSAWLQLQDGKPIAHAKEPNADVLDRLRARSPACGLIVAIEMVASYGMAVGKDVFETCVAIGRFAEACEYRGIEVRFVYRREVKLFHCFTAKANDANIRAAIIDRFGGKDAAIGLKRTPGPLHGIKADVWSALAIALTVEGKPIDLLNPAPRETGTKITDDPTIPFGQVTA